LLHRDIRLADRTSAVKRTHGEQFDAIGTALHISVE
jgi:hypothetical protein